MEEKKDNTTLIVIIVLVVVVLLLLIVIGIIICCYFKKKNQKKVSVDLMDVKDDDGLKSDEENPHKDDSNKQLLTGKDQVASESNLRLSTGDIENQMENSHHNLTKGH